MRCVAELHAKCAAGRCDADVLVAEATDKIERLLRRLLLREPQGIGLDLRFDRRAHLRRGAEKAICGHMPVDALMRPLEVVVLHEERDAAKAVREVREHGLAQEFVPQRLPEAFDLAERLGVLWSTPGVRDAAPSKQLLKLRRAAPRGVLAALIGQHLTWLAVVGDAALERVDHQARLLVVCHRPRHQVARVVVHEAGEVHALMASDLEREDVALPELIGLGAFEAARRLLSSFDLVGRTQHPGFVQDASDRRLGDAEAFDAREHVTDPPRAPLGVLGARRQYRVGRCGRLRACRRPARPQPQCVHPAAVEQRLELLHHRH